MPPRWIDPKNDHLNWVAPSFDFIRIPPDIQMKNPIYDQWNFRWRDDSTALNTDAGWLGSENVNDSGGWFPGTAARRRLRLTVDEVNNRSATLGAPALEYNKNTTGWNAVTTGSSNVRATGGLPTDDDACSTQLLGNGTTGSFETDGSYADDGTAAAWSHAANGFAEFEYCIYLVAADVAHGDTIQFRIAGLDTWNRTPTISVDKATVEIYAYQFVQDDGVEGSASDFPRGGEDTKLDVGPSSQHDIDLDENFRFRIGIKAIAGRNPGSSTAQLIYQQTLDNVLDCDASSVDLRMAASSHFASGDATTDAGLTAPGGGFTFVAGEMDETDGLTGAVDLGATNYTIFEFCLTMRSAGVSVSTERFALGVTFDGSDIIIPDDGDVPTNEEAILYRNVYDLHGRFRDDLGNETSGGAGFLAADDVGIEVGSGLDVEFDTPFRLRALIESADGSRVNSTANFTYLYYSVNGGPWDSVGSNGTTADHIVTALSPNNADKDATTDHGLTVSASGIFDVASGNVGEFQETDWSSSSLFPPLDDDYTYYEWCLEAIETEWNEGDVVTFMVRSDWGTPIYGTGFRKLPDSFSLTMPPPSLSVASFRWRDDDGVEGSGGATFLDTEEQILRVGQASEHGIALDQNVRLRMLLDETDLENPVASTLQLYYKKNGGAATDVTGSSTNVRMSASSHFASGDATTDHGFSAPAGTFLAGEMDETDGLTGSLDLAQNQYTIVEFCVQFRSADVVGADAFTFGLTHNSVDLDTSGLDAFGDAGVQPLEAHGRFRNDDGNESSGGATFISAQDVDATVGSGETIEHDTKFRLRTLLEELDGRNDLESAVHALWYRVNGGAAVQVGGQGVTDKYIRYADTQLALDVVTTDHGMTVTATGVFAGGRQREALLTLTAIIIDDDDYSIDEWGLETYSANWSGGDVVEFLVAADRVAGADGHYLVPLTLTEPGGAEAVAATDGLKLGDTGAVGGFPLRVSATDGLKLGDTGAADIRTGAAATDGLKLGDTGAADVRAAGAGDDGLKLGDSASVVILTGVQADGTDGLDLGDVGAADIRTQALGVEGLDLSDTAAVAIRTPALAADGLELGDSATVDVVAPPPPGYSTLRIVFG